MECKKWPVSEANNGQAALVRWRQQEPPAHLGQRKHRLQLAQLVVHQGKVREGGLRQGRVEQGSLSREMRGQQPQPQGGFILRTEKPLSKPLPPPLAAAASPLCLQREVASDVARSVQQRLRYRVVIGDEAGGVGKILWWILHSVGVVQAMWGQVFVQRHSAGVARPVAVQHSPRRPRTFHHSRSRRRCRLPGVPENWNVACTTYGFRPSLSGMRCTKPVWPEQKMETGRMPHLSLPS